MDDEDLKKRGMDQGKQGLGKDQGADQQRSGQKRQPQEGGVGSEKIGQQEDKGAAR